MILRLMLLTLGAVAFGASLAIADGYHDQQARLKELDKRCEEARQAALKPVRAGLVTQCVDTDRRGRQDCELHYANYGESTTGARGNIIKGMFYDLPACQEAQRAWESWEASQPLRK
jgi:hypothetical protein